MTERRGPSVFTPDEEAAIRSLERLAKRWPQSLTLFSWSGSLTVVKSDDMGNDGFHSDRTHTIFGIPNDGGDPDDLGPIAPVNTQPEEQR